MPQLLDPKTNDVHAVGDELADYYRRQGWVDYVDPELAAAAAAALEQSGNADGKRQRSADKATQNTPKE
jgi:hypothetical protein